MNLDEAIHVAQAAKDGLLPLPKLLEHYAEFQKIVHNTATVPAPAGNIVLSEAEERWKGELLHAALGLVTESAEIADALKKNFYGKQKPISRSNLVEEAGDIFYYLHVLLAALNISLEQVIAENVHKLANRYIEKFHSHT